MSITHSLIRSWQGQNGTPLNPPVDTLTGTEELNLDFSLAGGATNQQESLAFTKTLLQSIFIWTDAENITFKTNSSSVPQDTFTIQVNVPFVWDVNSPFTNPFGGNVTTAFFTNSSGSVATNVHVRCLTNG